jgi:phosphate transport system substrate-binding protein
MKKVCALWILTGFALFVAGCGAGSETGSQHKPVTVKGSDTMVILAQRWAETYMKENPGLAVQVTSGALGRGEGQAPQVRL